MLLCNHTMGYFSQYVQVPSSYPIINLIFLLVELWLDMDIGEECTHVT